MANSLPKARKSSPIYWTWANMKKRCKPGSQNANRYHDRGIGYTSRWETFDVFHSDMWPSYKEGMTLDRIDNDGDYTPDNCRWATPKQQANNRSNSRRFTINGKTKTFAEWIDLVGIKSSTVRQRFYVYNWSLDESLGLKERGKQIG